jgi:hypothetical protein
MMMSRLGIFPVLLVVMLWAAAALASPPVLSHQGRLLDAADHPVSGSVTLIYSIYDVPVGGAPLWTEDHAGVAVTDGLFTVELGTTVPLSADLFSGSGGGGGGGGALYLQITVAGEAPLMPRLRLGSAPSAVSSTRVTGDIHTAPGVVVMGDTATQYYATFGEKVNAGLHAAGSALASGASLITNDCDDADASFFLGHSQGSTTGTIRMSSNADSSDVLLERMENGSLRTVHALHMGPNAAHSRTVHYGDGSSYTGEDQDCDGFSSRLAINSKGTSAKRTAATMTATVDGSSSVACGTDADGDGLDESSVVQSSDGDGSSLSLRTDDNSMPNRISMNVTVPKQSGRIRLVADLGNDGIEDHSVESSVDLTSAKHAINTKGTGGTRVVRGTTDSIAAASSVEADLDGDGVPENSVLSISDATTARMAIKTKGTGASNARTAKSTTDSIAAASSVEADLDGDGTPENFSTQVCTADSVYREVSVADPLPGGGARLMKAKEKANRTKCSSSLSYRAPSSSSGKDDDCDGFSASRSLYYDSDGDQVPENDIQEVCLPTSSFVAIKTKGTGAANNRTMSASSSTSELGASSVCGGDLDGDGLDDIACAATVDDSTGQIGVTQSNIQVSMRGRKGWDGTIKGRIAIDENGVGERVRFDSDGDGYLSGHLGLGVSAPVHAIDVSGGAYCDGSNWVNASDASLKENFADVNGEELLKKIASLPISEWNYKAGADRTKHIGPTAQDFKATFGVGSDGKSISTIDPSGIALAAIKELSKRNADLAEQNAELSARLEKLQQMVEKLASQNANQAK